PPSASRARWRCDVRRATRRWTATQRRRERDRSGVMKIYGHPMSTCTRKVLMTLAETNTPYELQVVEFATGEHKKPPHLARQPFGQVPALQDGDFELYESRAMCRYINDKASGSLVPRDLRDRAK